MLIDCSYSIGQFGICKLIDSPILHTSVSDLLLSSKLDNYNALHTQQPHSSFQGVSIYYRMLFCLDCSFLLANTAEELTFGTDKCESQALLEKLDVLLNCRQGLCGRDHFHR
jgi:hypothetical protein